MAEAYGTRPSELLGVADPWTALCLDEALFVRYRLSLSKEREGGKGYQPSGYDLPANKDLARIPWSGDGPDPLGVAS